jgi:hypothetical protein
MGMIRKLPSLTPAEFSAHWSGPHGVFGAQIPNLRHYHQNHSAGGFSFVGLPDRWNLNGLSELWFDGIEPMLAGVRSPAYGGLASDTPKVMTMPGLIAGTQEVQFGGSVDRSSLSKAMVLMGRNPALTAEDFFDAWRRRSEGFSTVPGLAALTNTYVSHWESVPGVVISHDELPVDLVVEFWFASPAELQEAFASTLAERLGVGFDAVAADASAFATKTFVIVP